MSFSSDSSSSRGAYEGYDGAAGEEEDLEESECDYRIGGYHRVHTGEIFHNTWQMEQKLGWGHFSTVWLTRNIQNGTLGALKIQKSAENYVEAAEDEIDILNTVLKSRDTPQRGKRFVVKLLDSFSHRGPNGVHPVMVFEVLGDNLLTLLDNFGGKNRGLPLPLVQQITWQLCAGMAFLHDECQVLHCDLKLENVLISGMSLEMARRLRNMRCVSTLQRETHPQQPQAEVTPDGQEEGWTTVCTNSNRAEVFYSEHDLAKLNDLFWGQNFEYKWMPSAFTAMEPAQVMDETCMAWIPQALVSKHCTPGATVVDDGHKFTFQGAVLELVPHGNLITEDAISRLIKYNQYMHLHPEAAGAVKPPPPSVQQKPPTAKQHLWRITNATPAALQQMERKFHLVFLAARFPLSSRGLRIVGMSASARVLKLDKDCRVKPSLQRRLFQPYTPPLQQIGTHYAPWELTVKICDLGNACWKTKHFSDTIQTRQYRAPEILLDLPYDEKADVWSVACLVFELYTGEFLFDPESSKECSRDEDHLALITELLGVHAPEHMRSAKYYKKPVDQQGGAGFRHINRLKFKSLKQVFKSGFSDLGEKSTKKCTAFLLELLQWDPKQRISMAQCLQHPFLAAFAG